ncbi:MAG: hypothetical protein OEQ81_08675 [Flavobacteriaceae bacterium]|nr:hypothetical protein [Flavobacteriaceae bacterium]
MNRNKEILIGLVVGLIANTIGTILYVFFFVDLAIPEAFQAAIEQGTLGSILALGAILNLLAFFGFLKIRRDDRAKGVLIATLIAALVILFFKIF